MTVLFVGKGTTAPAYYRILLPAYALGHDYVGVYGTPATGLVYATGIVGGDSRMPDFSAYDVLVVQQPGEGWLDWIRERRASGQRVLFEVDDYLHAIRHTQDHAYRRQYGTKDLRHYRACMAECDGLVVSTPFLADTYGDVNEAWVCRNGIDPKRYELTVPRRPSFHVGWSGATGHRDAITPWLQQLADVMKRRPEVCFVSVGQAFARPFAVHFGPERAITVPFCSIENYPAAMTLFDVALAPAAHTGFYHGKSDLRWLEASALGIPTIVSPIVYDEVKQGVTGFVAEQPHHLAEWLDWLLDHPEQGPHVGQTARHDVLERRHFRVTADDWLPALHANEPARR